MNNMCNYARPGSRWSLQNQAEDKVDNGILQANKNYKSALATSRRPIGVSWFEWFLIVLAAVLFIMTVTAQLCIYFKQL
ncbi:MAG: hypothetical protein ABRQ26_16505 [Syntrophomonadaceae bacterium]